MARRIGALGFPKVFGGSKNDVPGLGNGTHQPRTGESAMNGYYVMEAIPPYVKVSRTPVEVVRWLGNRVLLRDLEMAAKGREYLIETDLKSFEPEIPQ